VGSLIADWNQTHVFNPAWSPHARFHEVAYLCLTVGASAIGLWLLWRRSAAPEVGVAAWVPVLAVGSFFVAELVPGAHLDDQPGQVPRLLGMPANLLIAGLLSALSAAGYGLYRLTNRLPQEGGAEPGAAPAAAASLRSRVHGSPAAAAGERGR
jgi:Family of unknown function (DUF6640)